MGKVDIKLRIGTDDTEAQKRLKLLQRRILRNARQMEDIGKKMSLAITAPIIALGAKSVDALAKIDAMKKGLQGMMGSAELAADEFERLRDLAKLPGLSLESVVEGSVKLQAIGFSADKAAAAIKIFGNAVALVGGTGEDLAGVNLAISQIVSKGKVQAEEINQIAERLPQVRKAMQDAFGTADTEVLQKMGLSAEEFVDKITLELAKLPEAQMSVKDSLQNMRDDINVAFASLGEVLAPVIKKAGEYISKFSRSIQNLNPEAKRFIVILAGFLAIAGPIIAALGAIGVAATAVSVAMSPMTLTIAAIVAAIAGLVAVGIWLKENWSDLPNFFDRMWAMVLNGAIEIAEKIYNVVIWPLRKIYELLGKDIPKASFEFAKVDVPERQYKTFKETLIGVSKEMDGLTKLTDKFNKKTNEDLFGGNYTRNPKGGGAGDSEQKSRGLISVSALNGGFIANAETEFLKSFKKINDTSKDVAERIAENMQLSATKSAEAFKSLSTFTLKELNNIAQNVSSYISDAANTIMHFYDNKQKRAEMAIDSEYEKEKNFIENSIKNKEKREEAIQALDYKTDQKRKELSREQAKANKKFNIFGAAMNTALAITNALANIPAPGNYVAAGITAALGAAQIAAIASEPLPALADGGIIGKRTDVTVGEYPGAAFNPEIISPLDKLQGMIKGVMGDIKINLMGGWRVNGYDLETVLEGARAERSRLTI